MREGLSAIPLILSPPRSLRTTPNYLSYPHYTSTRHCCSPSYQTPASSPLSLRAPVRRRRTTTAGGCAAETSKREDPCGRTGGVGRGTTRSGGGRCRTFWRGGRGGWELRLRWLFRGEVSRFCPFSLVVERKKESRGTSRRLCIWKRRTRKAGGVQQGGGGGRGRRGGRRSACGRLPHTS